MKDVTHRGVTVPWRYMIATHGEDTLKAWSERLRLFRFCRAVVGGHAADGDSLQMALEDNDATREFIARFEPGEGGWRRLDGIAVWVSWGDGIVRLALSGADGDRYAVTARDVENACLLEAKIAPLADHVIDPPLDSGYCLAPKFWPEVFVSD